MTDYLHEAVEVCPHCMGETTVPGWTPSDGYRVKCSHCGESILLCDECFHAEDNPRHICDWDKNTGKCFRDGVELNWFEIVRKGVGSDPHSACWSDIETEILCATEELADRLADRIESLYEADNEDVLLSTGYYNPEEDKRNNEEDEYTCWWYVQFV